MKIHWRRYILCPALAAASTFTWAADAQSIASLAADQSPGRQQLLIEAARQEGTLTFYTSIAGANVQKLRADFESKYGIKMKLWRAGDSEVLQRVLSEAKVGRSNVDVVNIGTLEMEMLYREKLLQPIDSPLFSNLIAPAVSPHKEWVSTFVNVEVQAYNSNEVAKADLPKTYQDLLDPKWKGKLAIEATTAEWFYSIVKSMGEEAGLQYFRDLVATNGLSVRNGHSLLNNLVASGEVPLGITVYNHSVLAAQRKGAPIDYTLLDPAVAVSFSMGIPTKPAHPNAALLFYEYMLTDGQKILAQADYVPTRKDIKTRFSNVDYTLADIAQFLDEYDKWTSLWQQIVVDRK